MKKILFIFITSTFITTKAFSMTWTSITLTINNIDFERGGEISVYVFTDDDFPVKHNKALKRFRFDVSSTVAEIEIQVPDVPFAIKAHHDEDFSGTVTKNWTGFIPAEGLGFSSGAKLGFGPPSFKDAVMTIPENAKTEINLTYP